MITIDNHLSAGIYLLLCNTEEIAYDITLDKELIVFINFAFNIAIKVPKYFNDKKLRIQSSSIESLSSHPNQLYSVILSLIEKHDFLMIGTSGLSKESIVSIIKDISSKITSKKQIIFVHTSYNKKTYSSIELFKIDNQNSTELLKIL